MTREEVILNGDIVGFERRNLAMSGYISNLVTIVTYSHLGIEYEIQIGNAWNSNVRNHFLKWERNLFYIWLREHLIKINRIPYFISLDWEGELISPKP